jgi:hypothetical protein
LNGVPEDELLAAPVLDELLVVPQAATAAAVAATAATTPNRLIIKESLLALREIRGGHKTNLAASSVSTFG